MAAFERLPAIFPANDAPLSGVTREELLETFTWVSAGDATARDRHRAPYGGVSQLCEILEHPDIATDQD
ncbi:MAG: hypothetical protein ACR2PO_21670 [Methyloligellaceae bacterium]